MIPKPPVLRKGWTTGACATAATRAALARLWGDGFEDPVAIILPRGERPSFSLSYRAFETGLWAEAGVIKDAGDDPDVTHGAEIRAHVCAGAPGSGVVFKAGVGVGMVTKPGLPIGVGEPAINPVPRQLMSQQVIELAKIYGQSPDIIITISIPDGAALAAKTWNPRLGIVGGLSVLGTTGIVRPFSCAAWIASIHRGIDVGRAGGLSHLAGATGAMSEAAVRDLHDLPEAAMLDMGDFVGGLLKYLRSHPVERLTIGGGMAKMAKLGQGAMDLHSKRGQVDFMALAALANDPRIADANTVLEAYETCGTALADAVAQAAAAHVLSVLRGAPIAVDVVVVDRGGKIIARTDVLPPLPANQTRKARKTPGNPAATLAQTPDETTPKDLI